MTDIDMTDIISICHGHASDEMDVEAFATFSYEDFCQPGAKCDPIDQPTADTRCISIDSETNSSIDTQSTDTVTDGYSDISVDYDILPTVLGTGNYGCVRECVHRSTGKKYAVKIIEKSEVGRLDHVYREIETLRSIDHSGIMKMVDCYEDADYVRIVTRMYTGGELFDKIIGCTTSDGCLTEHEAIEIIKPLLEAVQYLHSKDIVHRDIKPENILYESAEEGSSIKLIDFGLSRIHGLNDADMTSQVGTPYYMSPGILQGKYDRSCDLWSIGIMTYILLCGYPPFNGATDEDVHDTICKGDLVFARSVWGNLSDASRDFVSKLLCMDSSEIPSAAEALKHPWIRSA